MADSLVLDLSEVPDHPTVMLPEGDFELRTPDELTFQEFGRQMRIGKELIERAASISEEGVLEELQALVIEAAHLVLINLTDEAAENLTPGRYLKISSFFNSLTHLEEQEKNKPGLKSAPDASDSTESAPEQE